MATVDRSFEGIALKFESGSKFSNPEAARAFCIEEARKFVASGLDGI